MRLNRKAQFWKGQWARWTCFLVPDEAPRCSAAGSATTACPPSVSCFVAVGTVSAILPADDGGRLTLKIVTKGLGSLRSVGRLCAAPRRE